MNKTLLSKIKSFQKSLNTVILGQEEVLMKIFIGLIAGGHTLIEGVPGLAKTSIAKAVSKLLDLDFKRVSCTPDLLPSDLIGVNIYNPVEKNFTIHKGPIFSQVLLVDEINRAPAKVQSALLECMQEKTATIGETTFEIDDVFTVMATQNPIDEEGIYPLPLAEKDRFMLKVLIKYPESEHDILKTGDLDSEIHKLKAVLNKEDLLNIRNSVFEFHADEKIYRYILRLIEATRKLQAPNNNHSLFRVGASPRAAKHLLFASKAYALLHGESYVLPDHVQNIWGDVMRHRLLVDYYSDIKTIEDSLSYVLDKVEIY